VLGHFFCEKHPNGSSENLSPRLPFSARDLHRPVDAEMAGFSRQQVPEQKCGNEHRGLPSSFKPSSCSCLMMALYSSINPFVLQAQKNALDQISGMRVSSASSSASVSRKHQAISG
jgi:hypothetical protein